MSVVFDLFVMLHLLGMAAIVGGYLVVARAPRILPAIVWGARAQIITGLILVGLAEGGATGTKPDHAKIAVKLVVALVVVALAEISRAKDKRGERVNPNLIHAIGGLAILNVAVATLWQ
jgi:hypothetical protein